MPSYVRGSSRRRLTDSQIVELYVSGLDSDSIGARANCSGSTVLQIVRNAGQVVRASGRGVRKKLTLTDAEILRRYRNGDSGPTLADAAGTTTATIYKIIRELGGTVRPPTSIKARQRHRPPGPGARDDG